MLRTLTDGLTYDSAIIAIVAGAAIAIARAARFAVLCLLRNLSVARDCSGWMDGWIC